MINCIFYALFFSLFLNASMGSLRFSQINRSFLSIYKGMLEACVLTIDTNGEPVTPYYNKDRIENYVITYLEKNIKRYSNKYTFNTTYYDENFLNETKDYVRGVSIKLNANINYMFHYEKEQRFSIKSRENI